MEEMIKKEEKGREPHKELFSERITKWIGSPSSLVVHSIFFITSFSLIFAGVATDMVLLILNTIVSLEAIYLAIFIQMTVNRQAESLEDVEEDIDEIQEDVEEISKEIDEISEDIDDIQEHDETKEGASLDKIEAMLRKAVEDLEKLRGQMK